MPKVSLVCPSNFNLSNKSERTIVQAGTVANISRTIVKKKMRLNDYPFNVIVVIDVIVVVIANVITVIVVVVTVIRVIIVVVLLAGTLLHPFENNVDFLAPLMLSQLI